MVVTLEVSKLSGWLNADASCRESNRGHAVRGEGAGQQTGATASSMQVRARLQIGDRTGVERTRNMKLMSVTLEVSKPSGWLNADAYCRGSKGGHVRYGTTCAGQQMGATASSEQWRLNCRFGVEQA